MRPAPALRRSLAATALLVTTSLAGCGGDEPATGSDDPSTATTSAEPSPTKTKASPSATPEPAVTTVQVRIQGGTVEPEAKQLELGIGEPLRLEITSDREGELHVHSSPEEEPGFPSGKSTVTVRFDKPGQIDIEEHESGVLILRVLVR